MSSRALRKLQNNKHEFGVGVDDSQNVSSSSEDDSDTGSRQNGPSTKPQQKTNPFLMLDADDRSSSNDHLPPPSDEGESDEPVQHKPVVESTRPAVRKKKKKKNKLNPATKVASHDDIDATLAEVNEMFGPPDSHSPPEISAESALSSITKALLSIEHRYLNADNEMSKIFGSKVVKADRKRKQNDRKMKHLRLVKPKDSWPPSVKGSGLSMEPLKRSKSCHPFKFEHSSSYQKTQLLFWEAVRSMDPHNITRVLERNPYHIDSLLQLSDICRMNEDVQMAVELIERALYAFENSFHPLFSLTQGSCRLEYKYPENRAFYIALFKHLVYVGQRGCYRTALEFSKLILSFEPDTDPLCVLLMVDFYAIRSSQYTWLIQLYDEWETQRNLMQLPNFALSVPLAMYHQSLLDSETDSNAADKMLQDSLIMFPSLLLQLLDKIGVVPDQVVSAHPYFGAKTELNQPKALSQLIALYIGRSSSIWKEPEALEFLHKNVQATLKRIDNNDSYVQYCTDKRSTRYIGAPRNIYRHIILSEIKDATAALPPDVSSSPVFSYDPLPPSDNIESYTYSRPTQPALVATGQQHDQNLMTTFFQSLLPSYNLPAAPANGVGGGGVRMAAPPVGGGADNGQVDGANYLEGYGDMNQSIGNLVGAMRDLLLALRRDVPEPDAENNNNNHNEDEEQDWEEGR